MTSRSQLIHIQASYHSHRDAIEYRSNNSPGLHAPFDERVEAMRNLQRPADAHVFRYSVSLAVYSNRLEDKRDSISAACSLQQWRQ
ncbi:hypothetical protein CPSG_01111 [Coccidioides posadasii str. Silveira]|uniref:Uncharacterized protein n=1 Tax=Coccidioides posadasii (strain RMSCC 757 / Silveira) TaxID=443226 RepID=E9CR80_COCPS|nr:hypothetical protein CPSG_01111 [Coccidioides posadasii str. Silveira]